MLKVRNILGVSLFGISLGGYYQYNNSSAFRSLCHLTYAGACMAYIYRYSSQSTEQKNTRASVYLRDALRLNGGIYLKLGQLIATLDVIVPDQYRTVMSTLTRQCQKDPYDQVKLTIEQDLGYPIEVVFKKFEKQPISSASMAQVHRATLLNGEQVAVKVQHRHLSDHVQSDLKMVSDFQKIGKWLFKQFNYTWLVQGFKRNIDIEMNFLIEADNMKRTATFLKDNRFKNIHVPELLLKPTKRVLIMEYINGLHIDELEKLRKANVNLKLIGKTFSQMIIKMIHKEGFVHADPHAGNLMIRKLKNGQDQLVILDHGLYQELDSTLIRNYNEFWLGLILNDPSLYQPAATHLGTSNPALLLSILTSKSKEELNETSRNLFDLNPSSDKSKIMAYAAKNHEHIVKVLSQLNRNILLLLKVNEFARSIENMMSGRQMGVYRDIAQQCVQNLGLSPFTRWGYYFKMAMVKH